MKHLISAAHFSRICGQYEQEHKDNPPDDHLGFQITYVSAAVILSVCSLEAHANERYAEQTGTSLSLTETTSSCCLNFLDFDKKKVLEKHDALLLLVGKEALTKGEQKYQNANALISVRNNLVHSRPISHEKPSIGKSAVSGIDQFTKQLNNKFELNPFIPEKDTSSLYRYFSYGCAKWAVLSAHNFMNAFCLQAGVPSWFDKFAEKINPHFDGQK